MNTIRVRVSGAREVHVSLRDLTRDIGELKVMQNIAEEGARLAARYAPKRSGRLAISIRGNKAKRKAVIVAGKGHSRLYAGRVNYGDPRWRGYRPPLFMQRASDALQPKVNDVLERELNNYITRRGLR